MRQALGLTGSRTQRERPQAQPSFKGQLQQRGQADGQKRRFVRDGEVPVMMVSGARPPEGSTQRRGGAQGEAVEAINAQLRAEKGAREKAERALRDANATIQDLRTKLGHIALARDEAIEAARRAEASRAAAVQELEAVQARLSDEASARAQAERRADRLDPPTPSPKAKAVKTPAAPASLPSADAAPAAPKRRGRPPKAETLARAALPKRPVGRPRKEKEPEPIKWWVPKPGKAKKKG